MLKTAIIASAVLFGAATPTQLAPSHVSNSDTVTTEHTVLNLPAADAVVAQLSYLEIRHGAEGFAFSVTDKTAVFVDLEFAGDLHVRIGF